MGRGEPHCFGMTSSSLTSHNFMCIDWLLSTASLQKCPAEFAMYLNYCRGLRFEEAPDYMYLRQLYRILFRTLNHQYDYTFDWTILKQSARQAAAALPMHSAAAATAAATGTAPHRKSSALERRQLQRTGR